MQRERERLYAVCFWEFLMSSRFCFWVVCFIGNYYALLSICLPLLNCRPLLPTLSLIPIIAFTFLYITGKKQNKQCLTWVLVKWRLWPWWSRGIGRQLAISVIIAWCRGMFGNVLLDFFRNILKLIFLK
jgi:hypothetical protein